MQTSSSKCITLVLGGVRSGKSHYAQNLASSGKRVAFIATAEALDGEMQQRIKRHQEERPSNWTTFESPNALEEAVLQCDGKFDYVLIDCLTLWTSNLMMIEDMDADRIYARADRLSAALLQISSSVVLVSNEVGSGVVPASPDGRFYSDLLGGVNRRVAAAADRVLLMVAGYPLTVKDTLTR